MMREISIDDGLLLAIETDDFAFRLKHDCSWRLNWRASLYNDNGCEMIYGNGSTPQEAMEKLMVEAETFIDSAKWHAEYAAKKALGGES